MISLWKPAAKISSIYIVVGAVWILASDNALTYFFSSTETLSQLQTVKGWFYILTTGALLFWLVQRQLKTINESEERWRFALEGSGDGVWDWNIQADQVIYSKRWKEMLGYAEEEIGTELSEWSNRVHPEDMPRVMAALQPHLDGQTAIYINEHRMRCKDGSYKWILDRGRVSARDAAGKPLRVAGTHTDITDRKQLEEKQKLSATVFSHAREGIMITDVSGNVIEVNDTFSLITGYSREEIMGQNPRMLKSGRQSPEFYAELWKTLLEKDHWCGEVWNRRKNGEVHAELLTISAVRSSTGQVQNYVALFTDITQMKEHQSELERIAHYDILTNLPNRALLADRLSQCMVQCHRHQQSLAVAFLDLDGFKVVNDAHGHNMGDELLITLSGRMKAALREGDTLARIGGDEFVAVLADLAKDEDCQPVLDRLLKAAADPVTVGEITLQVSASIGVALYPQDNVDTDQLMRHADQAMYLAKQAGKNRYHMFDTVQDEAISIQRESIGNIRSALRRREFVLYYQPKVNMHTGDVIGVEALIRWQHPNLGLLSPAAFLPVMEGHDISLDVGEWVIDTALTQISQWQDMEIHLPISVNISAHQLQKNDFVTRLAALLATYPEVDPSSLELEILETSALSDISQVSATMNACRDLGVGFALDDFGTGYSSLTYLRNLPAHLIKIDQSFVRDMLTDADDLAIVEGVIGLAKSFKRDVIAEGVETVEHGTALLQLGCELAQGYGIARPMPASDISVWLGDWKSDKAWQL
jgi:diguanylate cyclase (GGDEF)-like protein/PAS domain S-box-containing protein